MGEENIYLTKADGSKGNYFHWVVGTFSSVVDEHLFLVIEPYRKTNTQKHAYASHTCTTWTKVSGHSSWLSNSGFSISPVATAV